MSDDTPPSWSAAEAATAKPRCPVCSTHDEVELVVVGTQDNRMRRWYCAAPFCHTTFSVGDSASETQREMHRKYFVMLRNYLEDHPDRLLPFTADLLAREPAREVV